MNVVGIIPARGGSVRFPLKNIAEFLGQPIIAYTIEAALESGIIDRLVVSTDDEQIADIATKAGAIVVERPAALATSQSTINQVCVHFLGEEVKAGFDHDIICCLYATAPLRSADDIRATVSLIEPGVCDFAMAVTEFTHAPYLAMQFDDKGFLHPRWPELTTRKSQDMGEFLIGNGSTYAASVPAFLEYQDFIGPTIRGHRMPLERSIDIDRPSDLDLATYFASRGEA